MERFSIFTFSLPFGLIFFSRMISRPMVNKYFSRFVDKFHPSPFAPPQKAPKLISILSVCSSSFFILLSPMDIFDILNYHIP